MTYRHLGQDIGLREEYHPELYPKCTTASEKTIAQLQCLARWHYGEQIRGLGAAASRFEGANPCWVANLPKCPVTARLRSDLPPTYRAPTPSAPRRGAIVGAHRTRRPALAPQPEPPRSGAIVGADRQPRGAIPPPPLPAPPAPRAGAIVGSSRTRRSSPATGPTYATPAAAAPLVAATANQIVEHEAREPVSTPPAEEAQGFLRRNWLWLAAIGTGGYLLYLRQAS